MNININNYFESFIKMITQSWTYDKLTEKEKKQIIKTLYSERTIKALKGTYRQRWAILQAIYNSFLNALDYNPINWRETEKTTKF